MILEDIERGEAVTPPPATQPDTPIAQPDLSWDDYGAKLPRDKARRALVQDGLNRLNDLPPAARDQMVGLLGTLDEINFKSATKSTKSMGHLGRVIQRFDRATKRKTTRVLDMQMMRHSEEWNAWVAKSNVNVREGKRLRLEGGPQGLVDAHNSRIEWKRLNPEPDKWRLNTPDEFADVLVHELGHVADHESSPLLGRNPMRGAITQDVLDEVWIMRYGGNRNWKKGGAFGDKIDAYEYATSARAETVAELTKFYLRGVNDKSLKLTAQQWRSDNPVLARWVEDNVLNG